MDLDYVQSHASFAKTISKEELEKWELVNSISSRHLRSHRGGVMQVSEFVIPETRIAEVDYCPDIKPGLFGRLVPGKRRRLAFVPVESPGRSSSALFSYQSDSWLRDRDDVDYEVVGEDPRVYDHLSFNMRT